MKIWRSLVAAALVASAPLTVAHAQSDWPTKPVRIVVPYPAGGATDVMGRIAAEALSQALGQQFVVENKGGASGAIGAEQVAKAEPDGYTLMVGTPATQVTNQYLKAKLPYSPEKDFDSIVLLSRSPVLLIAHPSVPANSVGELIELARQKPGTINFGSSGSGATSHLAGELFKSMAEVDIVHIPYKGAGPAMTDLLGGHVQLMFDNLQTAVPQVQAGKVKALGISSATRDDSLPDIPPIGDSVKGYEALSFLALFAPKGTPRPIIDKVSKIIQEQFQKPETKKRLSDLGVEPVTSTPEQLDHFLAAERAKWKKVIETAKITADE
jgi:tripartite-type tricarboxylate transporter receptor subunit TctC